MHNYYDRKPSRQRMSAIRRDVEQDTDVPLLNRTARLKDNRNPSLKRNVIQPLSPDKERPSEKEKDVSLIYHINGIVRVLQNRFKKAPLEARVAMIVLGIDIAFILICVLILLVILNPSPVYAIVGFLASVIALYEFLWKRRKKP